MKWNKNFQYKIPLKKKFSNSILGVGGSPPAEEMFAIKKLSLRYQMTDI